MGATSIEWTEQTWNPIRGCSKIATGCKNCYAERQAARFSTGPERLIDNNGEVYLTTATGPFAGFAETTRDGNPRWTGRVELIPELLDIPLRRRKPTTWFVNSMSDLFHESLPEESIDRVFAVIAACPRHKFIVLTKRGKLMRNYITWLHGPSGINRRDYVAQHIPELVVPAPWPQWPLPNVVLGVSASTPADADEQIPWLLRTPAACRMVSLEPLVGPVDLTCITRGLYRANALTGDGFDGAKLDWVIVGGESGPGARPCDVGWIRSIVRQCAEAAVPCFVKQLGARPIDSRPPWRVDHGTQLEPLIHRKGGDPSEWPEDLRVREYPEVLRG